MSSFSGLQVGLSSLYAQRRGLELAGHNVANANTEGYSRQRLHLEGNGGPMVGAIHSRWNGAGSGVDVAGVQRLRDGFLESRALLERGTGVQLTTTRTALGRIEAILGEPGDQGLQAQLANFWQGWDDVANNPTENATRSQLLERAKTLTTGLNQAATRLESQWQGFSEELGAAVQEINATAANVAELNQSIRRATQSGLSPNDLADQRDVLVQRLGELAGVTSRPGKDGAVDLYLGGTALVRGSVAEPLARLGESAPVRITWAKDGPSGPSADAASGKLGGLLTSLNDVLPRYGQQLDAVAASLTQKVNSVHAAAYTPQGDPGGDFFLPVALNPDGTVAAGAARNLTLAVQQPEKIAASSAVPVPGEPYPAHDGGAAVLLAEMASAKDGPDALYRGVVVTLGVEAQTAGRRVEIQAQITSQVDNARDAEAGVNLDEEMTSMLAYQRAYEGAARFVSAVDQMLDTLINRTGTVGR